MSGEQKTEIARRESDETYSVAEIREAFADYASGDDWGVKSFYEDALISALRGHYETGKCRHRFPDGTRCKLGPEAHAEVPGLAEVHGYTPAQSDAGGRHE